MKAPKTLAGTAAKVTEQWPEREPRLAHDGQIAVDRLLLYLRCLNLPEVQALGLTLRAVMEAESKIASGREGKPVAEAMQALFELLRDGYAAAFHDRFVNAPPVVSQPYLNRMHMVPEELSPKKTMRRWTAARRSSIPAKRPKNGAGVSA